MKKYSHRRENLKSDISGTYSKQKEEMKEGKGMNKEQQNEEKTKIKGYGDLGEMKKTIKGARNKREGMRKQRKRKMLKVESNKTRYNSK
jgi:hypothetical protein